MFKWIDIVVVIIIIDMIAFLRLAVPAYYGT